MNVDLQPGLGVPSLYDAINRKMSQSSPVILIVFTIIIIFYYVMFNALGTSTSVGSAVAESGTSTSSGVSATEIFFWGLFVFLILINGLQYFFSLDIKAAIRNIFSPLPEIDVTVTKKLEDDTSVPEIKFEKQVFNIPENTYTYDDAKAVCKAYGARLASYDEVEKAYNDGGEWCNYGWSKKQMILFPTQKQTFDKLQKKPGHENDCGRPGINGGFIANPNARFGVNCYGYKPEITQAEMMAMNNVSPYPLTKQEKEFEHKVEEYRKNLPDIMVSPFNHKRWSII